MNLDILKLTPLYDLFGKRSFSQFGEDIVVDSLLGRQKKGFYVDIGAFHPKIFSNTYMFYKRGWRGICVEPNPGAWWKFWLVRPRDVFVNCGVGDVIANHAVLKQSPRLGNKSLLTGIATVRSTETRNDEMGLQYFVFGEEAVNTFSAKMAKENKRVGRKLLKIIKVPVRSLESILDEYLPKGQKIDILSVDVEGMDLAVLKSNNWKKYRPRVIIAEDLGKKPGFRVNLPAGQAGPGMTKESVATLLVGLGYELVGMTGPSIIFEDKRIGH